MDDEIKILAVKYIAGQATDKEILMVRQWIAESKENEESYVRLYETWHNSLYADPGMIDTESAYKKFISGTINKGAIRNKSWRFGKWYKYAAAAIVVLVCVALLIHVPVRDTKPSSVWKIVKVPNGVKKRITLADGTRVWINAGSNLKYRRDFGRTSRTVYLKGEAYFDIAHNGSHIPFLVQTQHFVIRDIGTVFNVKAYEDGSLFETAVFKGKVSVEGKLSKDPLENSRVFLKEKQVVKINQGKEASRIEEKPESGVVEAGHRNINEIIKVVEVAPAEIEEYNGWKDDILVFNDDTFLQIARILERRYDVKIAFSDEGLKDYKYNGSFRGIPEVTRVLEIIKKTTPITYKVKGNEITIQRLTY